MERKRERETETMFRVERVDDNDDGATVIAGKA